MYVYVDLDSHLMFKALLSLSYVKRCRKLALGQNCIKIFSNNSNSVATFLRVQTDINCWFNEHELARRTGGLEGQRAKRDTQAGSATTCAKR